MAKETTNEIMRTNNTVKANGFATLKGQTALVIIYHEIGIIAPGDTKIPTEAVQAELCHITEDGEMDSPLVAMECEVKGTLSCKYDEETGMYYWVRSETLMKDVLRKVAGIAS